MKIIVQHKKILIGLIIFVVCFLFLLWKLPDYNINSDEPQHFNRGQAYFNYFLTGKTNFSNLSKIRRSEYQTDEVTAADLFRNDSGHPPLNDILASFSNYIFYQKLGIMSDVNSYHLFEISAGALLILVVYVFASSYYGIFAGIVASLSLFLYPLFLGETHFNIKDPPEAAFYGLTILTFFLGITKKSWKWILFSSVACGFALGTKFNIVFLPFILVPWLIAYLIPKIKFSKIIPFVKNRKGLLIALLLYLPVAFTVFFASWPYLWNNTWQHLALVIDYYKSVGTGYNYQSSYLLSFGWNTYPFIWIFYTTPPVTLFLSGIGILSSFFLFRKEKNKISFLFLLWFILPVLRVSWPGSSIYGGIRQIMEYVPAMALLAGVGAQMICQVLVKLFGKKIRLLAILLILLSFIPLILVLIRLHPNENLYFNSFIGGLKGAKANNIPSWGNSTGNVYTQGIKWLNQHAEKNARVALMTGVMSNLPKSLLRKDINFSNMSWSGIDRQGEYLMEMIYDQFPLPAYEYDYVRNYLNPVFEYKVDGVTVLGIWKNDIAHTKPKFLNEDTNVKVESIKNEGNILTITLDRAFYITKLDIFYGNSNCSVLKEGFVQISDDGSVWERQGENIPVLQVTMDIEPEDKRLVYLFSAKLAKYIQISVDSPNSCIFNIEKLSISKLSDK